MAKSSRRTEDRENINRVRMRYYELLSQGYDKHTAAALAEGGDAAPVKLKKTPTAEPEKAGTKFELPRREPPKPVVVETTPEAQPAVQTAPAAVPEVVEDLQQIRGVGPGTVKRLAAMGVTKIEQIAAWTPEEAQALDEKLGYRGRITREDWIGQAKELKLTHG